MDEVPVAYPPSSTSCPDCGGPNIARGIRLGITAEVGSVGPQYRAAASFFVGTEPMLADVCEACGRVVRLYVRTPGRQWLRQE